MSDIQDDCLKLARGTVSGEVPLKTAEAAQDIYWTAVSDKAQENREFENGLKQENLKKAMKAMEDV